MGELAQRICRFASSVRGTPLEAWPAWSTGELLMVALVLNDHAALSAMSWTIVEAFDRVDLSSAELRDIERKVQALVPETQIDGRVLWR
jgi:hypothetical protein